MDEGADWKLLRVELARLARRRDCRFIEFSSSAPIVWKPWEVINPETDIPFCDSSAWELIATLLESGHPFREVVLRKPPGAIGYETELPLLPGHPKLYIKVQFRSGRIVGRSFHYSTKA